MKSIFKLIFGIIIFSLFQYISLSMYFNRDASNYAKNINIITFINKTYRGITQYFDLNDKNKNLNQIIANLQLEICNRNNTIDLYKEKSLEIQNNVSGKIISIGGQVINQTILKKDNIIKINKGFIDGVEKDMAIVYNNAVVGYIIEVNAKYCLVRSVLSDKINTSGTLKKSTSFCSIWWDGHSPYELNFSEMTKYSNVEIGDTITTTSFSKLFPKDINIGTVSKLNLVKDMYYDGKIKLLHNLKKIDFVTIISTEEKDTTMQLSTRNLIDYD